MVSAASSRAKRLVTLSPMPAPSIRQTDCVTEAFLAWVSQGPTDDQADRFRLAILNRTVHNSNMARPTEFDQNKALNKALVLFWRKGYQAASLTDLLATMDIGRSSFYAAFTDKRTLYINCIDLFAERVMEMLERDRKEKPPIDVLQDFFAGNQVGGRHVRSDWGCMLVNSVLELAGIDEDLVARASGHLTALQRFFETCLRDAGALSSQARELAAMLMLFNEGIRVSNRRRLPDAQHQQTIDATFRLIRSAIS